jgi:hypothetical protein
LPHQLKALALVLYIKFIFYVPHLFLLKLLPKEAAEVDFQRITQVSKEKSVVIYVFKK